MSLRRATAGRSFANGRSEGPATLRSRPSASSSADTLGCRVGIQRYEEGQALRVTELFRRDESGWRLVHRHADWVQPKGAAAVMR